MAAEDEGMAVLLQRPAVTTCVACKPAVRGQQATTAVLTSSSLTEGSVSTLWSV